MGDIGIIADRFRYVDFTEPYLVSGLLMIVKEETKIWKEIWAFMRTFTTTMWIILPISHIFIISVVWLVKEDSSDDLSGFGEMLWFSITVVFYAQSKNSRPLFDNQLCLIIFSSFQKTKQYYLSNETNLIQYKL